MTSQEATGVSVFDEATAVTRRAAGEYEALPDQRFALVAPGGVAPPAVNGGALIATVLRAVLDDAPHPYPVATNASFLRVARLEPAVIRVSWLKRGRTAAVARATLEQAGQPVIDLTVTTGDLPVPMGVGGAGPPAGQAANGAVPAGAGGAVPTGASGGRAARSADLSWTGEPPCIPAPEDCVELGPWPGTVSAAGIEGYARQVRLLFDPATTGWRRGDPSGVPEMRGYFGLAQPRDPDAYLLALAVDGLPPVVFGLGATGWAPTVELSWYMRGVPCPGLLRVATRCRRVSAGWFDEESEVWDAAGQLVAQSRQLARVGRGPLRARS
ncbi:MAG TPA: thioesterase family protein [Streptosporangiaceae bacterium]